MKIPIKNESEMPMYVNSSMILPDETRHFDEADVPHHLRPANADVPAVDSEEDALAELANGSVQAAIDQLPKLSTVDLDRLGELEQTGKARVTLLSAIAEEILNRQQDEHLNAYLAGPAETVLNAITGLSDVEVVRAHELEQTGQARAVVIEALAAESIKRQG